jgi:hypothetical protein
MNIGTIVIVKRGHNLPAWQAEFVGCRGKIMGQKTVGGVLHWLVQFKHGPALEYLPCELEEARSRRPARKPPEPQEAAA